MTFRISPGNSACISHFDHCLFRLIGIALLFVIFTRTQGLGGGESTYRERQEYRGRGRGSTGGENAQGEGGIQKEEFSTHRS